MRSAREILRSRCIRPNIPTTGYRIAAPEPEPDDGFIAIAMWLYPDADNAAILEVAREWAEDSRRQGYPRCRVCGAKTYEPCDAGRHG